MSRHDDHDDLDDLGDDALDPRELERVRAALDETRPPPPSDEAFARQADAVMGAILGRDARAAAAPAASWWTRLRERLSSPGRGELMAWAAVAALVLLGTWAAVLALAERAPTREVIAPEPTAAPQAERTLPSRPDDTPEDGDDLAPEDGGDMLALTAPAAPDDDSLGTLDDTQALSELAQLPVSRWRPEVSLWAGLAETDEAPGYDELEVLSADELARLERALSNDRALFPR